MICSLSVRQLQEMILAVADKVMESKPLLTEIDAKIGDGDHGIGMEAGFQKVKQALESGEFQTVDALFQKAGMNLLNSMGGASGVIFSSIFLGAAKAAQGLEALEPQQFAECMAKGLELVKRRGKAEQGDKTMVDAYEPSCKAMADHAAEGFPAMLLSAEEAARDGMERTKQYVAKFGRSKSLMERAVGFQDAGATSVYLMVQAMREWMEKEGARG